MITNKKFFSIKTKDANTVERILNKEDDIEFDGINILENSLAVGQIVFIVLGGDKPQWKTGLIGIGILSKAPYDKGYDKKNFKVQVSMKLLLKEPITRGDLIPYRDTYGTIGIAPIVKWEPNQALSQIDEKRALALLRAMLEIDNSIEDDMSIVIGKEGVDRVKECTKIMVEVPVAYGERLNTAIERYLQDDKTVADGIINIDTRSNNAESAEKIEKPHNRIAYGAPGTGKSYHLNQDAKLFREENMERVTFHPSYSYAHFFGCYKPISEGENIKYQFVPGPFIRIWKKAMLNKNINYLLLIEEINRADVAAVFGDVFQLLDRKDGVSIYPINMSEDLKKYLEGTGLSTDKMVIPSNMYIWATMNSADQGVYPMDTAFKRRWNFEYTSLDDEDTISKLDSRNIIFRCKEATAGYSVQSFTWDGVRRSINKFLSEKNINEDKLMGPFFLDGEIVGKNENINTTDEDYAAKFIKAFKNKVLMYLFDDAGRSKRNDLFKGASPNHNRYSAICNQFDIKGMLIFHEDINKKVTYNIVEAKERLHENNIFDIPVEDNIDSYSRVVAEYNTGDHLEVGEQAEYHINHSDKG